MATSPLKLPGTLPEFLSGDFLTDIKRAEQLLNALQNLRVQVTVNGTTQTAVGVIQISGDSALVIVNLT